jgi:hypothetical protein
VRTSSAKLRETKLGEKIVAVIASASRYLQYMGLLLLGKYSSCSTSNWNFHLHSKKQANTTRRGKALNTVEVP